MGEFIHEALNEHIPNVVLAVLTELKPGLEGKLHEDVLVIANPKAVSAFNEIRLALIELRLALLLNFK